MHLLLNATHKTRKVGTPTGVIELQRGQYISGRIELAGRLKQTEQQIRTSLKRLEELEIITIKSTNKYSVYIIENYNKYQDEQPSDNQQNNQQETNKQPSDNQQTTTKQELNNLNIKEKNIKHTALAMLVSMDIPESLAKDWLQVRKEKKSASTQTAFNSIKAHAEKNGYTFLQAVEIATSKSWAGFDVSWLEEKQSYAESIKSAALTIFKPKYIAEQTGSFFADNKELTYDQS